MTIPRPVAVYLRSILALDARIVSASLVVAFDSCDEERNGLVAAVERPRAYGTARFRNGLVWYGATGASATKPSGASRSSSTPADTREPAAHCGQETTR